MPIDSPQRIKVLILTEYYEPGFKGGGPIRTLSNLTTRLGDRFDFKVITRDRDLGDTTQYPEIIAGTTTIRRTHTVLYVSPRHLTIRGLNQLLKNNPADILYLNSFFSFYFSIVPMMLLMCRNYGFQRTIIAPRGEFSPGALKLKYTKKKVFIMCSRLFGLHRNVIWQASSKLEQDDIIREYGARSRDIKVAVDLVPIADASKQNSVPPSRPEEFTVGFISRISPKKNLLFLLKALSGLRQRVSFLIAGPVDDPDYWNLCRKAIDELPENICVKVVGAIPHSEIRQFFNSVDVFCFPTLGENFGHVIFESLCSGTPILLSDRTPWTHDPGGAITVVPLDRTMWAEEISRFASLGLDEKHARCRRAVEYANEYGASSRELAANAELFINALKP